MANKPKTRKQRNPRRIAGKHNSFYASKWWRGGAHSMGARKAILQEGDGWCVDCKKKGKFEPATEVDHIKPHRGNMALKKDMDNLQGLCNKCHSRKTQRGE